MCRDLSSFLVFSGCWEVSGKQDCHQSTCVANKKPPKALNNTKFCCCNSDLCNMNVSDMYVASQADDPHNESPGKNHECGVML
jgi:bone morphogenetic protein receptor type-2